MYKDDPNSRNAWVREQLSVNGTVSIKEVLGYMDKEDTYRNRNLARSTVNHPAVKGRLEREQGKVLSCKFGTYFLVEKKEDCDIEIQKRKRRGMTSIDTFRRILPAVLESFPELAPEIVIFSGQLMRKALDTQIGPIKELKTKNG